MSAELDQMEMPPSGLTAEMDGAPAASAMPSPMALNGMAASFAKVPVTVQVMLGTARIPLSELLSLKPGSLLALDQKLGEPVSVIVNGCKVATGELFVLEGEEETLAVKIKEIVSTPAGL